MEFKILAKSIPILPPVEKFKTKKGTTKQKEIELKQIPEPWPHP